MMKSYPYVLVSEYSREQAHLLDGKSLSFLKRANQDIYHALPVGVEYEINYDKGVDHMEFLHDLSRINERFDKASEDVQALQRYLAMLDREKTIGGRRVLREEFKSHKEAIAQHLSYKVNLARSLRLQIRLYQSLLGTKLERAVRAMALEDGNMEARIIDNLRLSIKKTTKKDDWTDELQAAVNAADEYLAGKKMRALLEKDVNKLFEKLAIDHADEVMNIDPGFKRDSQELYSQDIPKATTSEIIGMIKDLPGKDKEAIVHIARQLLMKKALTKTI